MFVSARSTHAGLGISSQSAIQQLVSDPGSDQGSDIASGCDDLADDLLLSGHGQDVHPRRCQHRDALDVAARLLEEVGISVTAGTAFGACGEGYFRISLGTSTDRIAEAMRRLRTVSF